MNERIQELEAQCWEHDYPWTGVGQLVFNREKFAELIVRECANQLDDGAEDGMWARSVLYEHFGVEE